jgi:hypothetical protein
MNPIWISLGVGYALGLVIMTFFAMMSGLGLFTTLGLFTLVWYIHAGIRLAQSREAEALQLPQSIEEAAAKVVQMCEDQEQYNPLLKAVSAADFSISMHHTLGRWIRNNWGLWAKTGWLYSDIRVRYQLEHADDMSTLVLIAAWHAYSGTSPERDLREAADRFIKHWEQMA